MLKNRSKFMHEKVKFCKYSHKWCSSNCTSPHVTTVETALLVYSSSLKVEESSAALPADVVAQPVADCFNRVFDCSIRVYRSF